MRDVIVEELERFIGAEGLWRADELQLMVERLRAEPDDVCHRLAASLAAVQRMVEDGRLATRLVADIEGVVYPRLWKVMEAVWDELPTSELSNRATVLDQRLAPLVGPPR
ncbi:MAG: hypothetical protein KY447_01140 [Actinobacteria bacterium]|nr:hypothetical protein [Actinomycetota bacterium]MBW3641501.1 hypothetical protein [Actinomycetota bacterium]